MRKEYLNPVVKVLVVKQDALLQSESEPQEGSVINSKSLDYDDEQSGSIWDD
ncbi:MAG: hypothetical protein IJV27_05360 [Prevotella sp.]|nr:hypothetical protein [Prevotella sp.]